jgi:hypothetical protein
MPRGIENDSSKQTNSPQDIPSPSEIITVQHPLPQIPFLLPTTADEPSDSDLEDNNELMETMTDDSPSLLSKVTKTCPNHTQAFTTETQLD